MAGVKVTDLNALGSADANDVFYIVDTSANESKKIQVGDVVNLQEAYDNGNSINSFNIDLDSTNNKAIIGYSSTSGVDSVVLGFNANAGSVNANITAIGSNAAHQNTQDDITAIGSYSGFQQTGASLTSIGFNSGYGNDGDNVIAIGDNSGFNNSGNNVVAIGSNSAANNTLSNMFTIGPGHLPSYADSTAAAAAINVGAGATAGNYYLYHDQSDGGIKAIIP